MSLTILIVDDEPYLPRQFARFLRKHGYEVYTVPDGESGLHEESNTNKKDISIMIDELFEYVTKIDDDDGAVKQYIFDYFNNQNVTSHEAYNWLLNNQNNSDYIFFTWISESLRN